MHGDVEMLRDRKACSADTGGKQRGKVVLAFFPYFGKKVKACLLSSPFMSVCPPLPLPITFEHTLDVRRAAQRKERLENDSARPNPQGTEAARHRYRKKPRNQYDVTVPLPRAITHFPESEEESRNGGTEGSRTKDRVYVLLF
jgi:hypothetical protein